MSDPLRVFTDKPSTTLAWLADSGTRRFLDWCAEQSVRYLKDVRTTNDVIRVYRAQGALEVLDFVLGLGDAIRKFESDMKKTV